MSEAAEAILKIDKLIEDLNPSMGEGIFEWVITRDVLIANSDELACLRAATILPEPCHECGGDDPCCLCQIPF